MKNHTNITEEMETRSTFLKKCVETDESTYDSFESLSDFHEESVFSISENEMEDKPKY